MSLAGRPLRFLALVVGGWIAVRAAMLWPDAATMVEAEALASSPEPITAAVPSSSSPSMAAKAVGAPANVIARTVPERAPKITAVAVSRHSVIPPVAEILVEPGPVEPIRPAIDKSWPLPGPPPTRSFSQWMASGWLVARAGGTTGPAGTLGGAQAGVRIGFRPHVLDERAGLFARVASPLATRGADAALGIEARPLARVPLQLALEQRVALERGGSRGTALSVVGGVSDVPAPLGFRLDGYGQAGVIGLRRRAGFVDGAVTLVRSVAAVGLGEIAVGAGAWGAAQPNAARLDIGPRLQLRTAITGQPMRIGVEWRQRVAGQAAPGSGPALTLGADF